jgi:hypothetical protein
MRAKVSPSSLLVSLLFATLSALCAQSAMAANSDGVSCKKSSNGYGGLICSTSGAISCKAPSPSTPAAQCTSPKTGPFECRVDEKGIVKCYSSSKALTCIPGAGGTSVDCTA